MKKRLRGLLGIYLALALMLASGVALAALNWGVPVPGSHDSNSITKLVDGGSVSSGDKIYWTSTSSGGFVISYNGAFVTGSDTIYLKSDGPPVNGVDYYDTAPGDGGFNADDHVHTVTGNGQKFNVEIDEDTYVESDQYTKVYHIKLTDATGGGTPDPDPGPPSGSGPDLWYIGCNQFGSSMAELPDKLWIDGVPVTGYAGTGGRFELDSLEKSARFITASWGGSTITLAFRPDDCAYSTQIEIPKTGGAPALGCALVSVIAALWACKLRRK